MTPKTNCRIAKTLSILFYFFLSAVFLNSAFLDTAVVMAEPLVIHTQGGTGEFLQELKAGEKASMTVHLKSLGDPVLGFEVALRDGRTGKPLQVLSSNENGIVNFTPVVAGTYQIAVQKKMNDRGASSSTTVGDIVFKVVPAEVEQSGEN